MLAINVSCMITLHQVKWLIAFASHPFYVQHTQLLTLHFLENLNDSRYICIGIDMVTIHTYLFCHWTQIYFLYYISFALNLSGFVVHLCISGTRIFIMTFMPERNTLDFSTHPRKGGAASLDLQKLIPAVLLSTLLYVLHIQLVIRYTYTSCNKSYVLSTVVLYILIHDISITKLIICLV